MIKNLNAGPFLKVGHYGGNYLGAPNPSMASGFGMLRYNQQSQSIEVYDGSAWINIATSVEVSLDNEAVELLVWAKEQKQRQEQLERLAKENVTIQDALNSLRSAEERLNIVRALCEQDKIS